MVTIAPNIRFIKETSRHVLKGRRCLPGLADELLLALQFDVHQLGRVGAEVFNFQFVRVLLVERNPGQTD